MPEPSCSPAPWTIVFASCIEIRDAAGGLVAALDRARPCAVADAGILAAAPELGENLEAACELLRRPPPSYADLAEVVLESAAGVLFRARHPAGPLAPYVPDDVPDDD